MAWTPEQELAINETGTNIIVSAGAGSGKTAVLTARTMRILNGGTHVNELLILTFTKAAAAEMKERIRKSIKKGIADNPALAKELELIDQAYITTFDSFALSVVKKYHYLLNISNNIAITDASIIDMQKIKIMDEVFDSYYTKQNPLFDNLIYDFCVKDDNDIKSCILKIATKIDAFPNRDEYLNNYADTYLTDKFLQDCLDEYLNLIKQKLEEINNLSYRLSILTDGSYGEKLTEALSPLLNAETIDEINLEASLTKLPTLPRGSEEDVKKSRDLLKSSLDELKTITTDFGNVEDLKTAFTKTSDQVKIIIEIVKEYLDKFHKYKEDNEIYDFQDIALLSIRVLKENESVRNELRDTFKEIMIDEYQDTNDIQETFISMIENHNVYMVGDIKQSIYRFRNANPYIFKNKYDNYAEGNNGMKIDLVKNFRSRREVLANINEVFNLVMDNLIGGAEYHESHQMVYGNTTYIEEGMTDYDYNFQVLEYELPEDKKYSKEEIEIFAIAKDIKDKVKSKYQIFDKDAKQLKDISYNDFVILMDRTTDFDLYKKIFEYLGIPLTLYKDDKLNNSDDIFILKNIIDFIVKIKTNEFDTQFKYDFISIARSYLYNLTDQEIFDCFKNNNFKDSIIYKDLLPISKSIDHSTISTLLETIINKTNMYEKMIKVGNIDASITRISKLYDIASNLSNLGYDIYTFRDYLNELLETDYDMKYSAEITSSNSVKIMPIHKSKGLEYHVCYYSGLYKGFNISDLKERFLFDNKYGIITPYFKEGINDTFIKHLVKYHYLEEEVSEKIRLFYVALTRAKETMILLTPKTEEVTYDLDENNTIDITVRRKYRSFSAIMNSIKDRLLNYYKDIDLTKLNLTKDYLYNNKVTDKLKEISSDTFEVKELAQVELITKDSASFSKNLHELITIENTNNMEFGLEMHEALELIDFINPDFSLIDNEFIKTKITKFLNNPLLSNINNANIYKEYEFMYEKDNTEYHGIIDLLLEYEEHIDIIDYKLNNIKDENYLKQLNGYKEYISTISNKPINIYLYSIISETIEKL